MTSETHQSASDGERPRDRQSARSSGLRRRCDPPPTFPLTESESPLRTCGNLVLPHRYVAYLVEGKATLHQEESPLYHCEQLVVPGRYFDEMAMDQACAEDPPWSTTTWIPTDREVPRAETYGDLAPPSDTSTTIDLLAAAEELFQMPRSGPRRWIRRISMWLCRPWISRWNPGLKQGRAPSAGVAPEGRSFPSLSIQPIRQGIGTPLVSSKLAWRPLKSLGVGEGAGPTQWSLSVCAQPLSRHSAGERRLRVDRPRADQRPLAQLSVCAKGVASRDQRTLDHYVPGSARRSRLDTTRSSLSLAALKPQRGVASRACANLRSAERPRLAASPLIAGPFKIALPLALTPLSTHARADRPTLTPWARRARRRVPRLPSQWRGAPVQIGHLVSLEHHRSATTRFLLIEHLDRWPYDIKRIARVEN